MSNPKHLPDTAHNPDEGNKGNEGDTHAQANQGVDGVAQNIIAAPAVRHGGSIVPSAMSALTPHLTGVRMRQGRSPAFVRAEVEQIRADTRPFAVIARHWGVSLPTIRRVKGVGAYSREDYIPADEYNRAVTPDGNRLQPTITKPRAEGRRPGRPLKNRGPLTPDEMMECVISRKRVADLAREMGVSATTISRARRHYRRQFVQSRLDAGETLEALVRESTLPDITAGILFGLDAATVRLIREGATITITPPTITPSHPNSAHHVTSDGNNEDNADETEQSEYPPYDD